MAVTRKIVHIDEDKCDGCGQCVPSCAEGAIRILDGKARLVSDKYCDGLGACLGHCPRDAISIIEREAPLFDEHATHSHLAALRECEATRNGTGGCPGAAVKDLRLNVLSNGPPMPAASGGAPATANNVPSRLGNWPLQLPLVPPNAPFLREADLLLVADCVPAAHPDFHRRFLNGRPMVMACPKLDNAAAHIQKLAQIIRVSGLRSITVLHMQVPCCTGLLRIAEAAVGMAGTHVPIHDTTIALDGRELTAAN
jgi:Pyruvate/2-oxoacid:ferredoxin oxidoreductase delta subunit